MSKKVLLVVVLTVSLCMLLFACALPPGGSGSGTSSSGNNSDTPSSGTTLKIGALLPMTGSEATYGADMLNSYKMAIDEVNAAGGVLGYKFEIFNEDDACDAATASTAGSKICSADPDFVVGGYCSGATIPALQLFYDEGKLMLISAANSTRITDLHLPQTFMVNSPGNHQIVKFMELLNNLGCKNVAIIHQGDDYTKNLSDLCDEMLPGKGYSIVTTDIMQKGEQDISAIVNKIRAQNADMVLWCGYYADGSNVIKQLRNGGYTGNICCGDGSSDTQLIEGSGPQGDGVYVLSPPYVNFAEGGQDYIDKYVSSYGGAEPGPYSTLCYDTIMLLVDGIKRANSLETDAVVAAIEQNNYQGLSGNLTFAPDHTLLNSNFIVLKINATAGEFEMFL
ncbi:MAG: branched-chain amino acid ABC transporter substrate-binding protein [Clostridiales bacterium]|nr:branched-chain amino acid ABC transporter substrate-binding protein [Clostridiales bacterium]